MKNGNVGTDRALFLAALIVLIGGCDLGVAPPQLSPAVANVREHQPPAGSRGPLHGGLRIRRDAARNRIWLLGLDDVRIYDAASRRLIRKIELPNWSVARFACDPDMVLDGSGSAIVSSNVQARLWRIDAGSFEVSEHQITLRGREHWEVGFATLAVSVNGTLFALTSVSESLWKIDLGTGSAHMVTPAAALLNLCGLTLQSSGKAAGRLDAFTNFVPAVDSDYAVGVAVDGRRL